MAPDLADALDGYRAVLQAWRTPGVIGRCPHALEHSESGQYRGVAGAALRFRPAGDEAALPADHVHVLAVGADVAGGDVAAAERLDKPPVGPQQGLGLDLGWVADDDGLAAAEVEPGQCVLVRHGPGEVQRVAERGIEARIGVETGTAQGRA